MLDYDKIMSTIIDITQLLHDRQCTYDEADEIAIGIKEHLTLGRDEIEYETASDWANNNKKAYADNMIIDTLNHVDGFI